MVIFYKFPNPYVISDSGTPIIVPKDFINTLKSLFIVNPKIKKILLITDDYVIRNHPGLAYKKRLCTKIFAISLLENQGLPLELLVVIHNFQKDLNLFKKEMVFFSLCLIILYTIIGN